MKKILSNKYVADDGAEFFKEEDCLIYEYVLKGNDVEAQIGNGIAKLFYVADKKSVQRINNKNFHYVLYDDVFYRYGSGWYIGGVCGYNECLGTIWPIIPLEQYKNKIKDDIDYYRGIISEVTNRQKWVEGAKEELVSKFLK